MGRLFAAVRSVLEFSLSSSPHKRRLPVAAQQLRFRQTEARENGRGAKRRARLTATLGAVANVEGEGLREGGREGHGPALATGFHGEQVCDLAVSGN